MAGRYDQQMAPTLDRCLCYHVADACCPPSLRPPSLSDADRCRDVVISCSSLQHFRSHEFLSSLQPLHLSLLLSQLACLNPAPASCRLRCCATSEISQQHTAHNHCYPPAELHLTSHSHSTALACGSYRSYEKRKQAALEIEHVIKELRDSHSKHTGDTIRLIIHTLTRDYAHSTQSNQRKGGLIGLAATSIALGDDTPHYLDVLLPPVLKSFNDQESRVRYYGCEALYNIAKVARGSVLSYFNDIFDGLCKLYADTDIDVKNGAQLLDRLIKDLVTESDSFDVEKFIPLLRERIKIRNPFIRQLLVGWISVLDSVPDIRMLDFLPEYLGGLFDMLSDVNKDIRQQAYAALAELLRERVSGGSAEGDGGGDVVSMVGILVEQCSSKDNFTRLTVLSWLHEFIQLDKGALLPLVSDVLVVVLQCLSDSEKEIRVKAEKVNESLLRLVEAHSTDALNYQQLLARVTSELSNKFVTSRIAALRWINMLVTKSPASSLPHLSSFFPSLLKSLQDSDDAVVRLSLEVLARVSVGSTAAGDGGGGGVVLDSERFDLVLSSLMQLFASDRRFLEHRGSLIIRQLWRAARCREHLSSGGEVAAGRDREGRATRERRGKRR